jgi:hypothetical protein
MKPHIFVHSAMPTPCFAALLYAHTARTTEMPHIVVVDDRIQGMDTLLKKVKLEITNSINHVEKELFEPRRPYKETKGRNKHNWLTEFRQHKQRRKKYESS